MKKRSKKRLPKYWLGTRMPTNIGYLLNLGGGLSQMSLTLGENLAPRTKALLDSVIPNALNKTMQYGSMTLNATNGFNGVLGSIGTNVARAGAKRAGEAVALILPDALPGATGSTTGSAIGGGASGAAGNLAGTASGVLGILGGAYGMYDAIDQFTRRGDTLSAGEISRTAPTMTMTTAGGNKYTQKGGIDSGAVLGYERANKTAKSANFAATTIGAGMATGAGIGMLAGSAVPGIGTAIGAGVGAGVGALIGGAGSLFDWFDNEDKVNDMVKTAGEINTAQNIQNKSLAYSKDLRQSFNSKIGAAEGKGPEITSLNKASGLVSRGEVMGMIDKNGNIESAFRVPGIPDTKDDIPAKGLNSKRSFVITNIGGLSDYAAKTGDIRGALAMQETLLKMGILKEFGLKKAKHGKLPKYVLGNIGESIALLAPHLMQLGTAVYQYNKDNNAHVSVPKITADYSDAIESAYRTRGDMIYKRPYFNILDQQARLAKWNARRNAGAGYGARLAIENSLDRQMFDQYAKTSLDIDLQNQAQRNKAELALQALFSHSTDVNNQNMGAWLAMTQQANAARENAARLSLYNTTMPVINASGDYLKKAYSDAAVGIKNGTLNLFDKLMNFEILKYMDSLKGNDDSYKLTSPDMLGNYLPNTVRWQIPFDVPQLTMPKRDYMYLPSQFKFGR